MESSSAGSIPSHSFSHFPPSLPQRLVMIVSALLSFLVLLLPSSDAVQCIIDHEFTIDRYKDISMVRSTCSAMKHCVSVTYEDRNPMKKQGWGLGCDKTDCTNIDDNWDRHENGQRCRKHRDYGSGGSICCCTKDFCNGIGYSGLPLAAFLLWVIA